MTPSEAIEHRLSEFHRKNALLLERRANPIMPVDDGEDTQDACERPGRDLVKEADIAIVHSVLAHGQPPLRNKKPRKEPGDPSPIKTLVERMFNARVFLRWMGIGNVARLAPIN